ncbi:MAG: phage shock envelope stress response protein PspM [Mycobacterium sp.]
MTAKPQSTETGGLRLLLHRGLGGANSVSDFLAHRINALMDPRTRLLRKRRWALRGGLIFAASSLFWVAVTALLASWSTPWWGLLVTCILATATAFPATLLFFRWRWLRSTPLPAQRPGTMRRLPPHGSSARPSMTALAASERGLFSLIGVMERGNLLPDEEVRELVGAANRTASTMAATANEVVSMERTVAFSPHARSYLRPTIDAFSAQLSHGARQYNEMVTAAAHLVATANGDAMAGGPVSSPMSRQRYREELVGATDRLVGWAQAFDELGELRRA